MCYIALIKAHCSRCVADEVAQCWMKKKNSKIKSILEVVQQPVDLAGGRMGVERLALVWPSGERLRECPCAAGPDSGHVHLAGHLTAILVGCSFVDRVLCVNGVPADAQIGDGRG